ncbi:MAG: hypothetical protein K6L80_11480 [Agarilytica sp.]
MPEDQDDDVKLESEASLAHENAVLKALLAASLDKIIEDEKIGRVFHDFNNILSSSMGYANLALERAKSSSDEKLVRYLDNIERAGIRARDLVRESLEARRSSRDAIQAAPACVLKEAFPDIAVDLPEAEKVFYSAEQLELLFTLLMFPYSVASGRCDGKVVDEFSCEGCGEDLRGVQLKLSVDGIALRDSGIDKASFALVTALIQSQAGHMCESLMQDKQFVVYLRSVTS